MATLPSALVGDVFNVADLGMKMLAEHDARITAAKNENAGVQQGVTVFDSDLKTVFDAANLGAISGPVAAVTCQDILTWWWQFITPLQQGSMKGAQGSDFSACYAQNNGSGPAKCSGTACTAACCIGNNVFAPVLLMAQKGFATGKAFTLPVCVVVANKYGLLQRAAYTLSWKPPAVVKEAAVTINKTTGVVSVGAPPSNNDVVITGGNIETTATSDQGGVAQGLPTATSSGNPTTTEAISTPATSDSIPLNLSQIFSNPLYLIIGGALLLLLLAGLFKGGRTAQPAVVYTAPPSA